jgi:F0F1-type ATP synthase assembly protein I
VNDALMLAIGLLADDAPRDTGPDFGKASPFGLVIIVLLLIGTFALVWSMNRHLRKLPKSFDESEQATESEDERRD